MGNKLEQLLNTLIQRGWKPFGKANRGYVSIDRTIHTKSPFFDFENHNMSVSTRELIAKESGLWQFVCENGMVRRTEANSGYIWELVDNYSDDEVVERYNAFWEKGSDYQYRLIKSALCDEDKLEKFLLSNIKVDE